MDVSYNFNKQISLTFTNELTGDKFTVKCPSKGRKPNIEISGTLLPVDYMTNVEIRVVNLYIENGKTFQKITVEAGYENSTSVAFEGQITNIYDESPGPEKVTVISCVQGQLKSNLNNTVSIALDKNFSLKNALSQIAKAAEMKNEPEYSFTEEETCASAFTFNGTVQEAVHQLGSLFPEITFIFTNGTIKAVKKEITETEKNSAKIIKFLKSPPQVVGTTVVIKAPWDPNIKPGDVVTVKNAAFMTKGLIAVGVLEKAYRVVSVEFKYSTVNGTNSMTIQGYYPEAK